MIVTSKRCYLNILTQLWTKERLLNANYYVGDQVATNGFANFNDQYSIDDYGQIINRNDPQSVTMPFCTNWHIKMTKCLDPEPFRAMEQAMGEDIPYESPEDRYVNHLNNPDTLLNTYNFLFKDQLEGNGLQILIFNDDQNILVFGHILCQYLSLNFGVDIIFIDPSYRSNCRGYQNYHGDKKQALVTIKNVRDYDLMFNFGQAISQSQRFGNVSNITCFLESFDFEQIMYLYTLLFPNDPIPPGNYTIDHIKQIIIGRCCNITSGENPFKNILINNWESVISRAEREDADMTEYY